MNNISLAFLLAFLAGMSTLIGVIPIFIKSYNYDNIICSSLSFASSIMLSISFFELIPESLFYFNNYNVIIKIIIIYFCIILGYIICFFIDKIIICDNSLYRIGILSMITIIIHNIPEGIITFISTSKDFKIGISLAIAIALHNIPEGISISIPIFYSTGSKYKAFLYSFISGISELFGAFLSYIFLSKFINDFFLGFIMSITSGIMIYISLIELLPNSLKYHNIKMSVLSFLFGFLVVFIYLFL